MRLLKAEFSELAHELDSPELAGLLHIQFGCLARLTRRAVDDGDRALVAKSLDFARRAALHGDDDVTNAVGVSFLEHLNFADGSIRRRWAFRLLSPSLREIADSLGVSPSNS